MRPFIPVTDELCAILRVDKPGDLPEAVRALERQIAIYSLALDEYYDSGNAIIRAGAKVKEWENE